MNAPWDAWPIYRTDRPRKYRRIVTTCCRRPVFAQSVTFSQVPSAWARGGRNTDGASYVAGADGLRQAGRGRQIRTNRRIHLRGRMPTPFTAMFPWRAVGAGALRLRATRPRATCFYRGTLSAFPASGRRRRRRSTGPERRGGIRGLSGSRRCACCYPRRPRPRHCRRRSWR